MHENPGPRKFRRPVRGIEHLRNLVAFQHEVGLMFAKKGWNSRWWSKAGISLSIIEDLSKAAQALDGSLPGIYRKTEQGELTTPNQPSWGNAGPSRGCLVHIADAVIKIINLCHTCGWNLEEAIMIRHKENRNTPADPPQI